MVLSPAKSPRWNTTSRPATPAGHVARPAPRGRGSPRLSIGCHTFSHRRLDVFNAPDWRRECAEARQWTARLTGVPVRDLAYPFGGRRDFDWRGGPGFLLQQGARSVCSNFGGWNSPAAPTASAPAPPPHLHRVPMIGSATPR
ncbi:MAG: hypothetical protein U1F77_16670 [Kiritimatiellia bacterium]